MIETKNVALSTFAVTIQALHVNGKQMTLSVFRQLPEITIFDENYNLRSYGYWGHVRYGIGGTEIWIVAEHGGRLYRSGISEELRAPPPDPVPYSDDVRSLKVAEKAILEDEKAYGAFRVLRGRSVVDGYFGKQDAAAKWGAIQWTDFRRSYENILRDDWKSEVAKVNNINAAKATLLALPQLFIAL